MRAPGDRIRVVCARVFSPWTLDRIIDPVLSDLRIQVGDARARGARWRSRVMLLAGYVTLLKVLVLCGCERALEACREWTPDDDRAFTRTIAISLAGIMAVTCLLALPPLRALPARLAIYVIPQAIPIAIPLGVSVGVFCGLGAARAISIRLRAAVLALAIASALLSLVTMMWMVPAAGQAFRTRVGGGGPTRSAMEMTITELRSRIDETDRSGWPRAAQDLRVAWHLRWAIPSATFVLALFAVSAMPRRSTRSWIFATAGCASGVAWFLLLEMTVSAAHLRAMAPLTAVWLPNLVFVTVSIAIASTRVVRFKSNPI